MTEKRPDLRLVWLFGSGADARAHDEMARSDADVLIQDLEDSTPPDLRGKARALAATTFPAWRAAGKLVCVRINTLDTLGLADLAAVMPLRPDVIAYPKAEGAASVHALDAALAQEEKRYGLVPGSTEILPVCETALGVVCVREMAAASPRVKAALLGSEDLTTDLCAERSQEGTEIDYARRRFLLECRAAGIEPVDAPFTFDGADAAAAEARFARRLGYRSKSAVRASHVAAVRTALLPSAAEIAHAREVVQTFGEALARGIDRVRLGEHWLEVPTYRNAQRLLARAQALSLLIPPG